MMRNECCVYQIGFCYRLILLLNISYQNNWLMWLLIGATLCLPEFYKDNKYTLTH